MDITRKTLRTLENKDYKKFQVVFEEFAKELFFPAKLWPMFAALRINEVHGAWKNDLKRVKREEGLRKGLDHFKRAGHLAFWARRLTPIIGANCIRLNFSDPADQVITANEQEQRDFLATYANEYVAFELGFQLCKFYEIADGSRRAKDLQLSREYYKMTCHFLKYKTVSPHALSLVYKSLFVE